MKPTPARATSATIDVPPLCVRAEVGSFNPEERTVDLIFSTGAPVERYDWMSGKRYLEKLAITPEAMRMDRLNAGAPLLDSHSSWSVTDQLGAVVPGSARVEKGKAVATVKFSARDAVADVLRDVTDGIIRSVSVGYRVHKFEEDTAKGNALPVRTAIDWEPFEISMVSMPADTGAKVRRDQVATNQCVLVTRAQGRAMKKNEKPTDQSETILEDNPLEEQRATEMTEHVEETQEPTPAEVAQGAERARVQGILSACRAAKMPSSMFDKLVKDGTELVDAQRMIFEEMSRRVDPRPNEGPNVGARRVEMGVDPFVHVRAGIENSLLHRVNPAHFKLDEVGRQYRGMSLLDIARVYLNGYGVRTTEMPKMELAGAALGLVNVRGMHTTSDFPLLLADVANKSLRADYDAAPQTFDPIVKRGTVPDFKLANRVQIGDAPALAPVNEHGEFKRGTIEEGREQVQAASYGRVFAITRRALVNDDTDAFSKVPAKFGRMAKNLESDLVWYQILKNGNMADSVALFHATHANYAGAGDISVANIGSAERAMMVQRGLDGSTLIVATPKYLIVGPTKKVKAQQFVASITPAQASQVNPYAGQLTVIVEPRLEVGITIGTTGGDQLTATGSAYAWYLAADKGVIDIVELVFLEGQSGPVIESRVGFDVDGLEIKCRHDVGAKVIDYRGLYKSDGTDAS